jgi:hypothetical protein
VGIEGVRMTERNKQRRSGRTLAKMADAIRFLLSRVDDEFTRDQFAVSCGLNAEQVDNLLRAMRKGPNRQIRVCRWVENKCGVPCIPSFEFGSEPDAVKREKLSPKLRRQLYLVRQEKAAQQRAQAVIAGWARGEVAA